MESLHAPTKRCLNPRSKFALTPWKQQEPGGVSHSRQSPICPPAPLYRLFGGSHPTHSQLLALLCNTRCPLLCTTSAWCPKLLLHTVIICQSDFKYANKNHIVGVMFHCWESFDGEFGGKYLKAVIQLTFPYFYSLKKNKKKNNKTQQE